MKFRILLALLFSFPLLAGAELRTAKIFNNHMVLQREQPVPVWGWAKAGATVTVKFADQQKTATTDSEGKWLLRLDPLQLSSEGTAMEISSSSGEVLKYGNILVGDVWICSGQSNMEWSVRQSANPQQEIQNGNHPMIRLFNVPGHEISPVPIQELRGGAAWQICDPNSVANFSAVGYYFGRELNSQTKVPIGLLGTNWGGTRVEPWTPPVGFASQPELKPVFDHVTNQLPSSELGKKAWDQYFQQQENWLPVAKQWLASGKGLPPQPAPPGPTNPGQPTAIYNAMVAPLVPYAVKGAIWYQGESNSGEGMGYLPKLKALVEGWRKIWNQGEHPFYFYVVQLANFQGANPDPAGGDGFARVRVAQKEILQTPDTGLACIIDIGEANDIHPKNKQDVGKRLAQWALRDVHGKTETVVSGPIYQSMKVEGNAIRISFDYAGGGLIAGKKTGLDPVAETTDKLQRFAICGEDRKWHWADAKIDGETVIVTSPQVSTPIAVRYAYSGNPEGANLYNKAGLPAVPFRTDNF